MTAQDATILRLRELEAEVAKLQKAQALSAVRLEILTGRMRACHEESGQHGLLAEAEAFCREAREALTNG